MTRWVRLVRASVTRARKLARVARRPAWWRALRHGVAPSLELEHIPFACVHRTVFDVGAGRGQFALLARWRFPGAAIHCLEPGRASFATLRRVMGDDARTQCYQVAAGAEEGAATLHLASDGDSSSLLAFQEQVARFGTAEVGVEPVRVAPLDAVLPPSWERPALLKIDVQGGELDVLRGASRVLSGVDEVLVEVSFQPLYRGQPLAGEVIGYLWERGFTLAGDSPAGLGTGSEAVQSDLRFLRRDGGTGAEAGGLG